MPTNYRAASRRQFLKSTVATLATAPVAMRRAAGAEPASAPQFAAGFIGAGIRFHSAMAPGFTSFGPCAAICDVDARQRERALELANEQHKKFRIHRDIDLYGDYRRVLDRSDIPLVVIATPDHWHTRIAIEALQAGKDVYCEKPVSLTIREGQLLLEVLDNSDRVFQVGTQQRTEFGRMFATAAALVRQGRIGKVRRVTCAIGGAPTCPSLAKRSAPTGLDWNQWLGQAPSTPYRQGKIIHTDGWGKGFPLSRTHRYFRWWYEYSGGKITDWGAHHVDIALWALDLLKSDIGQIVIEPRRVVHPLPMEDGYPVGQDRFNTATQFHIRVHLPNDVELIICHNAEEELGFANGIMFEGSAGRFFVNRGKLTGKPVEDLVDSPLPENALDELYGMRTPNSHIGNFIDCVAKRVQPISDLRSHHRMLSICHAVNIAIRLNRQLTFDTSTESFVADGQADGFLQRTQREGFEITT